MKKGKWVPLAVLIAFFMLLLAGLLVLMGGGDNRRVFSELGKKINRVKLEAFDRFWGCALRGENLKTIRSNTELSDHLLRRAAEVGQPYAQLLRDECLPMLRDIEPELEVLIVQDVDLKANVSQMASATGDLRSGLRGFVTYLDKPDLEYDEQVAEEHVRKITRAWYEFRKASSEANKLIKTRLEG